MILKFTAVLYGRFKVHFRLANINRRDNLFELMNSLMHLPYSSVQHVAEINCCSIREYESKSERTLSRCYSLKMFLVCVCVCVVSSVRPVTKFVR